MKIRRLTLSISVILGIALLLVGLYTLWSTQSKQSVGINVESIRLSAGGYMLDFRYKITDSDQAVKLLKQAPNPVLIDEATGAKFIVPTSPKVGALKTSARNGTLKEGAVGFTIFANPGQFVKPGNLVTVSMGKFKAEHLIVQ